MTGTFDIHHPTTSCRATLHAPTLPSLSRLCHYGFSRGKVKFRHRIILCNGEAVERPGRSVSVRITQTIFSVSQAEPRITRFRPGHPGNTYLYYELSLFVFTVTFPPLLFGPGNLRTRALRLRPDLSLGKTSGREGRRDDEDSRPHYRVRESHEEW